MPTAGFFEALVAPGVRGLTPYVPGKPIAELERELGIRESIKLASNENPLGPPAAALEAIRGALGELALYPDGAGFELRNALAAYLGVEPVQITLGNGSNDVLVLLAETFLTPQSEAVWSQYGFLVYDLAVRAASAVARVAPANPAGGPQPLGHDLAAMRALVNDATRLVFVANPNNPTGTWIDGDALREFVAGMPRGVIVVVDEAYAEYVTEPGFGSALPWIGEFPNLVVTRTFSKIYGLAGLRLGYAVSHPEIAGLLNRVRQPFNVNALAQAAGIAALADEVHVQRSRAVNRAGIAQLRQGLEAVGWNVPPSAGNFVLADTGGPAGPWYEGLLRKGVIVRPVANYGLPDHLRITAGTEEQNGRLLAAVRELAAALPELPSGSLTAPQAESGPQAKS